jgi:hypothetical protein
MLGHDRKRYPGGCMGGFIAWVQMMWRRWSAETGATRPYDDIDHAAFDGWLTGMWALA